MNAVVDDVGLRGSVGKGEAPSSRDLGERNLRSRSIDFFFFRQKYESQKESSQRCGSAWEWKIGSVMQC